MLPAPDTVYDPAPHKVLFVTRGWKWQPEAPPPVRDENGVLHFDDFPDFVPNKTPKELIHEGSFGGGYFWPFRSRKLALDGPPANDQWSELPGDWLAGIDVKRYLTGEGNDGYTVLVNKYKVSCDQSIEEWLGAGWFQWYSRFYQGRRVPNDRRQINKWLRRAGPFGIWRKLLLGSSARARDKGSTSAAVDPYLQQMCHHWAYEAHQQDIDAFKEAEKPSGRKVLHQCHSSDDLQHRQTSQVLRHFKHRWSMLESDMLQSELGSGYKCSF